MVWAEMLQLLNLAPLCWQMEHSAVNSSLYRKEVKDIPDLCASWIGPGVDSLIKRLKLKVMKSSQELGRWLVGWLVGFSINVYMSLRLCKTGS
jgi:hypothetical protein